MSFDNDDTSSVIEVDEDTNYNRIIGSLNDKDKILWSQRQKGTIYELLMNCVRFQFKYDGSNYYCYNVIIGWNIDSDIGLEINNLFDKFTLLPVVPIDTHSITISTLWSNGINIIIFPDYIPINTSMSSYIYIWMEF